MIDDVDAKILTILQQDARASSAEIARQIGMAPSAIHERMRKLEARGVIEGYETRVNPEALAGEAQLHSSEGNLESTCSLTTRGQ